MEQVMTWDSAPRTFRGFSPNNSSATGAFTAALNAAKEARRLSVKEVARILQRTPRGVERLLAGDNAPSFDTIIVACREFHECWEAVQGAVGRGGENSVADAADMLAMLAADLRRRA